ncbi:MAG TPA: glutathione peroxidase [Gemmatimonadales bacterium]|nr:glutathione peroxidase [Gemmatimonadales bacterium]
MTTADWSLPLTMLDGRATTLSEWRGRTLLIVNVASRCGYTYQYEGLEALWRRYRDRGLVVLGVPCDQFAHQEPGSAAEIAEFCRLTYDVTFPLLAKTRVNGPGTHPLYRWLKRERRLFLWFGTIKWNFTKFLVDPAGRVAGRWGSGTTPEMLEPLLLPHLAR